MTGDDILGANDLKQGLQLLANGKLTDTRQLDLDLAIVQAREGPAMFDDEESVIHSSARRESVRADILSTQEISQVKSS